MKPSDKYAVMQAIMDAMVEIVGNPGTDPEHIKFVVDVMTKCKNRVGKALGLNGGEVQELVQVE